MITIGSCYNEAHDDLIFNVIGATMVYYNLTFNVIGATMESPSQTPLLAYINQEFVAIKRNCLDGTPVTSLARRGAELANSRLTSPRDPSALLREVPLPLSFCRAPPSVRHKNSQILYSIILSFSQC